MQVLNRKLLKAYGTRGFSWFNMGNFDRAIEDFNTAVNINPNDAEAFYDRAKTWQMKGNIDQAKSDAKKTLDINPTNQKYQTLIEELNR